jgi:hypothetical protein
VKEHVIGTSEWIPETPCELAVRVAALCRAAFANPKVALYSSSTKSAGCSEGEREVTNPQSRMDGECANNSAHAEMLKKEGLGDKDPQSHGQEDVHGKICKGRRQVRSV